MLWGLAKLNLTLFQYKIPYYALGYLEVRNFSSDAGPYYLTHPWLWDDTGLGEPEGRYEFKWTFWANNCSDTDLKNWNTSLPYSPWERSIVLTIAGDGKNPSDPATLAEDSCRDADQSVVVQAVKQIEMETEAWWSREDYPDLLRQCTELETQEKTPKPEACAALGEEAAKKVVAETKKRYEELPKLGGQGNTPPPDSTSTVSAPGASETGASPSGASPSPSGAVESGASGLKVLVPTMGVLSLVVMMVNFLG